MESDLFKRAQLYSDERYDGEIKSELGSGEEGGVWETIQGSALKVFERERNYNAEVKCYQILERHGCCKIDIFNVPELLGYSDQLMVVEMTIVTAPYLLDFGKAYFQRPDFSPEVWGDAKEKAKSEFGSDWQQVQDALYELQLMGIYYVDENPRNIRCREFD